MSDQAKPVIYADEPDTTCPVDVNDLLPCRYCGSLHLQYNSWYLINKNVDAIECQRCHAGAPLEIWQKPPLELELPPRETQESVSAWAVQTFGPVGSNLRVAARANEEMAELLRCLSVDDNSPNAPEECADVIIVLMRLLDRFEANMHDAIDAKMAKNRQRKWEKDGSGHGYHVRMSSVNGVRVHIADDFKLTPELAKEVEKIVAKMGLTSLLELLGDIER